MSATFLSVRERERLRNQIEQDKRRLNGEIVVPTFRHIKEGSPTRQMGLFQGFMDKSIKEDPAEILQRMKRYQNALSRGTPNELSRRERTKLEKQVAADREWLKAQMVPKKLYYVKESDPDFKRAVEGCKKERSPQFAKVAERYKQAMRQLDTETPDASSVEKLRPS